MVKAAIAMVALFAAGQAYSQDWQRPDCAGFDSFSECRNAERNNYRRQKQQEFREKGLSFWYYERPDFSGNEKVEKAIEDKVEGALYFSFTVERDGSVSGVTLKENSSASAHVYAEPILAAIKNWQFVPADKTWPDQEWRYQFFFEEEKCEEDSDTVNCDGSGVAKH